MEWIASNHEGIAWVLLWAWIALSIFIIAFQGSKPFMVYIINLVLLAGFIYFMFMFKP